MAVSLTWRPQTAKRRHPFKQFTKASVLDPPRANTHRSERRANARFNTHRARPQPRQVMIALMQLQPHHSPPSPSWKRGDQIDFTVNGDTYRVTLSELAESADVDFTSVAVSIPYSAADAPFAFSNKVRVYNPISQRGGMRRIKRWRILDRAPAIRKVYDVAVSPTLVRGVESIQVAMEVWSSLTGLQKGAIKRVVDTGYRRRNQLAPPRPPAAPPAVAPPAVAPPAVAPPAAPPASPVQFPVPPPVPQPSSLAPSESGLIEQLDRLKDALARIEKEAPALIRAVPTCPVCWEPNTQPVVFFDWRRAPGTCGHAYCESCAPKMAHKPCPVCRRVLTGQATRVYL